MPTRAPALLGVALALTLGLSACGGDDDTTADPPVAPSTTTPSTDPTASPTAEPPPTQAPAGETARQFIERWFALEKYAQNTGDTASYRAVSAGCESCTTFIRRIQKIYTHGGSVQYAGTRITSFRRLPSEPGTSVFNVGVTAPPTTVTMTEAATPKQIYGGSTTFEIQIQRSESGWSVVEAYEVVS